MIKNFPTVLKPFVKLFVGIFLGICLSILTQIMLAQASGNLLVSAAASLQPSLKAITANYSGKVTYNFGGSGALQQQIMQGAPVDVFISAGVKQMNALETKGLLSFKTNLLTNQLVLITPKNSPVQLSNFSQLVNANIKRIAIADPRSVPVGQYAQEVLENLGIFAKLQSKFVLGNSVRFVLTAVESGEVDAGIVYISDAKNSEKVLISTIADQKLHSRIIYPISIIKSSQNPKAAKEYVEFLQSNKARAVFQKYGFGVISKS
jgi:molybdate transport system substrate-binding protein